MVVGTTLSEQNKEMFGVYTLQKPIGMLSMEIGACM